MPAVTFFLLLRQGREIKRRERDIFLYEMTNIAAIPMGGMGYVKEIQKQYWGRIEKPIVMPDNVAERPAIQAASEAALNALSAFFGGC